MNLPDDIFSKTVIRFNSDNTFNFRYFPYPKGTLDLTEYEIVNAVGKWTIEKDYGSWVISMYFITITNALTGQLKTSGINYSGFHINKDKPPYEIYIIVGDPDSCIGITLQKK
ncbi:MAG: hypothetical protein A2Y62_16060 [Candidatus Fischerbacteria bacterium RBG_13_37_8]|uniref:Uncharacterized protein n=1 Tax=Candidatus Fischerbacteria bacterium RBG_13_37_8 TaxID=1817863 RepID=A0A1F5VXN3_9BACT|nr:MAG: hypothetical protein A2Y62_16060 [Candidatus Fischerbacteria bacterium RBG_13_37_8]